jgi:hypothetical protein
MEVRERSRLLPPAIYVAGLVLVFLGERVFSTITPARLTFTIAGVGLAVAYLVVRAKGAMTEMGDRRSIDRVLAVFGAVTVLALALALTTTEAGERVLHIANASPELRDKFETLTTIAWLSLLVLSAVPILFGEGALLPMRRTEHVEVRRVLTAEAAGLTLALAAAYGALFTYTAGELDVRADFSYFRTSRPSDSTKNIVKSLTEPVKVMMFFPQLSEVGREVGSYVKELGRGSPKFTYEAHDRLLEPSLAKDWKVTQDGVVVLARGPTQETLIIGAEMEAARPKLKTLDGDFQKQLIKVSRETRTAYLTSGHGELNESNDAEGRTATGVRKLLESQNYTVKDLGLAQGLGTEIPKDATMVLVLGPARPFMPGEVDTLKKYLDAGGHVLMALDPDFKTDFTPLSDIVGLAMETTALANEKVHLRRRFNDSDRTILVTNRFSSHASITTLSRNASHANVIFAGAAALDKKHGLDPAYKVDFTVKAMPDTFADTNGDFRFEDNERRTTFNIGAAVSRSLGDPHADPNSGKEMRAFVLGDADAVSDAVFGNEANVVLFIDAVRWLGGEESFMGAIASTEDVKIEHTKQKDLVWFYGTIFAVPSLVLGLGLLYSRRSRAQRPRVPVAMAAQKGA